MRLITKVKAAVALFALATVVYAIKTRRAHGSFLLVPYDFRPPTPAKVFRALWNPDDPRLLMPHPFGIGWTCNLYHIYRWVRERRAGPDEGSATMER